MADTRIQFIKTDVKRRLYTQYTQGSVASFATQFVTDWASVLPNSGQGLGVVAKPGASTVAEIVINSQLVLEVNPTDFVGMNFGVWEVIPKAQMGRTVSDGATNSNTTVTSATAAFASPADVGAVIAGPGILSGTTIASVTNSTTVVISAAATATATGQTLTITPAAALYTPDVI